MNRVQELFYKLDNIFKSNNLTVSLSGNNDIGLHTYLSILFAITQEVALYDIESELDYDRRADESIKSIELINKKRNTYDKLIQVLRDNKIKLYANLTGFWIEKSLLEYELTIAIDKTIYNSIDKHIWIDIYPYDCNKPIIAINDCLEFSYHIYDTKEFIKLEETEQDINSIPIKQTITKYYKPIN